ncbi:MAG: DNA-binding transcriptional LysR family regulator [Flavobacteriales bacterium]|jgi:DNA-binding transcriptional LysR family regulator
MGQLEDMAMFVRIVDAGGISKAAVQLNIAKSAVSRRLNELEKRLCVQLLSRTTRKSSLTEAGAMYYQRALNVIDEVSTLNEQTSGVKSCLEGTLKITAPLSFGLLHLSSLIDEYAKEHNKLNLQLDFSDRHIDLVEEGYELAIRIGTLQDSSLQAKRLTPIRHVLCASPEYLRQHGRPKNPSEITDHDFLQYGLGEQSTLQLTDAHGVKHSISIQSKMRANNGDFLLDMAKKGHGIAFLPKFIVYKDLANGELEPLLKEYQLPEFTAYAVYPKNRFLSQRCRLLIDYIAERFGDNPYWDQVEI